MTVYLGEAGKIELQRSGSGSPFTTTLIPADVNLNARRFSLNFLSGALITGDHVDIARVQDEDPNTPEQNLELVEGHDYPDWRGYVNVDALGGVRLYDTFSAAVAGSKNNAVLLVTPSETQQLRIRSRDSRERCLGQIQNYELTTTRETIDITTLAEQFRHQYNNGLISGQGTINCFWEHTLGLCDATDKGLSPEEIEFSAYLAHLCIRVQQGAGFLGKFYIYDGGVNETSVWYQANCIVNNVSINVTPDQIIQSSISFITTGPIILNTGYEPALLLQEDRFLILQEDGTSGIIASPSDR